MPSLRDIALKCGCSVSVVSRALNPKPDKHDTVSSDTKDYIRRVALEMDFKPNRAAAFLGRGKTATIGVFLPSHADSLLAQLVMGISQEACGSGFPVSFHFGLTEESYADFLRSMTDMSNSGIITYPAFAPDTSVLRLLEEYKHQGGNMILLNTASSSSTVNFPEDIPVVAVDNVEGGRLAANRLLARGCEKFLLLLADSQCYHERREGFNEVLSSRGKSASEMEIAGVMDEDRYGDDLRSALPRFIGEAGTKKIGIFAGSDYHAAYVLPILKEAGLKVGRDALLVGFDDQNFAALLTPALTTVRQPFAEAGKLVMRKLINMIDHRREESAHLTPRLIVRESA